MSLFDECPTCSHPCTADVKYTKGTLACVDQDCPKCHYHRTWFSQPFIDKIPAGNLLLSGAILGSGLSYIKTLRMLESLNVATIAPSTFQDHAQDFVQPTVNHMWQEEQQKVMEACVKERDGELVLGGDGRVDSPGHCGKFGSYNTMDLEANKVIAIELVQV